MKYTALTFALTSALFFGCANQTKVTTSNGYTVETLKDGSEFSYQSKAALEKYDSIYLKSIDVLQTSGANTLTDTQMMELKHGFRSAFQSAMAFDFDVVGSPGPNTLVVEAKIGDEMKANPAFSPTAGNPADDVNTFGPEDMVSWDQPAEPQQHAASYNFRLQTTFYGSNNEALAIYQTSPTYILIGTRELRASNGKLASAIMYSWCQNLKDVLVKK